MKYNFLNYFPDRRDNNDDVNEATPIMMAFSATSVLMMAYRFYKEYMTKASRECGSLQGRDKNLCMLKFELDALEAKKSELERGLKDCEKTRDPKKCESKINKELRKTENKLKKIKKQFDMIYKIVKQEEDAERKTRKGKK